MRGFVRAAMTAAMLSMTTLATAADPERDEPLPPPVSLLPAPLPPEIMLPPQRANPYDVWQFHGVDRRGFWRPRVNYSPYGSYYLYNGEPYPFVPMHQRDIMPYIVD